MVGNYNNFDAVRIGLALTVMFAHIATLTQAKEFYFLKIYCDSDFAVKGFFAISGFLVAKSFLSSKSTLEYFDKRLRRIYPAYILVIVLCLLIGLITTSLNTTEFLKSPQTIKYAFANLLFLNFIQPTLPGVYVTNPVQTMNGSLWTIKVEVMLYICIPALICSFKRFGSIFTTLAVFLFSVAWVYFFTYHYIGIGGDELARQFPGQLSYFTLGSLFAFNENINRKIKEIAVVSLLVLFTISNPFAKIIIDPIAYSSVVIFLSTVFARSLNLGKYGDISYGLYLYHFPITQLLIHFGAFKVNAYIGFLVTLVITFIAAYASWHFVEKKLLKRSSHYVVAT